MANKNSKLAEKQREENIQATVSSADKFYSEHKKLIWTIVAAVVVLGLGILGYQKFIYQPKCAEAMARLYPAEQAFANGDFETALNGDGNVMGIADVIDSYGSKAGKSVYFYAAVCEYELGNYDGALAYIRKYSSSDPVMAARALSVEGDCCVALNDYPKAAALYEKAAALNQSPVSAQYLIKAGTVYEELGDKAKALELYKAVRDRYPQSLDALDIDKYITRISE